MEQPAEIGCGSPEDTGASHTAELHRNCGGKPPVNCSPHMIRLSSFYFKNNNKSSRTASSKTQTGHKPIVKSFQRSITMPVFQETSNRDRDLRILPSRALPLPRLSHRPDTSTISEDQREVVVIGVRVSKRFLHY